MRCGRWGRITGRRRRRTSWPFSGKAKGKRKKAKVRREHALCALLPFTFLLLPSPLLGEFLHRLIKPLHALPHVLVELRAFAVFVLDHDRALVVLTLGFFQHRAGVAY